MDGLLDWADTKSGLKSIGLKVVSLNERAIHLYESRGFVIGGRFRESVRYGANLDQYTDEVLMTRCCAAT